MLKLSDFILVALSHVGTIHGLHLTTIPHLNELVLKVLHLIGFRLLFFPIERSRPLGDHQELLGGFFIIDLVLLVQFLDLFVTSYDVVHDYLVAVLRDV